VEPRALRRKLMWRIVPLVFLLYLVAYLDRANLAFVQKEMTSALGFSPSVFGNGVGVFFVGYLLLEIPGALLVEHWSARKWFSRILLTWGLCSMAQALVRTPGQFYLVRFLLGLAEAGFFPGIIVYFTHWFPRADRARALAGLILGVPLSQTLGAWVTQQILHVTRFGTFAALGASTVGLLATPSGNGPLLAACAALPERTWLGLAGWQWVFVLEGFPALVLGVVVLFRLTDRPRQASWLSPAEADWLEDTLAAERRAAAAASSTLGQVLRRPAVWLLALGILATNTGGYALGFWLQSAFESLLKETRGPAAAKEALWWIGLYYLAGTAGIWVAGQSSDRRGERKWHCIAGQVLTAACLAGSLIPGQPWAAVFFWLCLTGFFAYFWPPPFWVLPTQVLSASAAAVAIGFINICANVAGMLGPPAVGWMKEAHYNLRWCLLFSVACYALGGVIIALLRVPPSTPGKTAWTPPPSAESPGSPGELSS
jgi:ACS family tartrate transporter-like MFS transporter